MVVYCIPCLLRLAWVQVSFARAFFFDYSMVLCAISNAFAASAPFEPF